VEVLTIFGIVNEVFDNEKNTILLEILNKYLPEYIENGKGYISNSNTKTKVIKISIEHISGKARR